MKLYEITVQEKGTVKDGKGGVERHRIKSHLVIENTGPAAKSKTKAEFGPGFNVGKPNMIADFNPR